MGWALATAALLLALVGLALAAPLDLAFRVERADALEGQVRVGWLFGLLRMRFPIATRGPPRRGPVRVTAKASPPRQGARAWALVRNARFRRRFIQLLKDLWAALRWNRLDLQARLGLDDPADTGRLWALVGPVSLLLRQRHPDVHIEPDFAQAVLRFRLQGQVRLVPLRVLLLGARFVLAPQTLRAWRACGTGSDG